MASTPAPFVLDCSVTMAWLFAGECTERDRAALKALAVRGAVVPALWRLEVANCLVQAEKKQVITRDQAVVFLDKLSALPIDVIETRPRQSVEMVMLAAQQFALTAYDAAYLMTAMEFGCPIVTKDKALQAAAVRARLPEF